MEVQPLGRDVGAEQHADRVVEAAEAVHQLLLIGVGELAVEEGHLGRLQPQVCAKLFLQPRECLEALGEHDEPIGDVRR
jgi:hypothetical protein